MLKRGKSIQREHVQSLYSKKFFPQQVGRTKYGWSAKSWGSLVPDKAEGSSGQTKQGSCMMVMTLAAIWDPEQPVTSFTAPTRERSILKRAHWLRKE